MIYVNKKIVLRVGVIIIKNESLLLTHSQYDDEEFWLLPGGGLEFQETLEECGVREIKEETGLDIKIEKLLYVRDFIPNDGKNHVVDIFFLGKIKGGELKIGVDPDHEKQKIKDVKFVPIENLENIKLYPKILPDLIKDVCAKKPTSAKYLGNVS